MTALDATTMHHLTPTPVPTHSSRALETTRTPQVCHSLNGSVDCSLKMFLWQVSTPRTE
jgi:hypothetical protein